MKKLFTKAVSVMLAVIMLVSCLTAAMLPAAAATENGYDRGYDGGFAGDGTIYCKGLDLSSWQAGAVNFTAIAAMGYEYIILRLGTSKMTSVDTCFEEFYAGAKAAGLDVGAYFYSYATTEAAVQEDIAKCKEWLGDKQFEYPFYFDYEDSSQADLPTDTALTIINTFIEAFVEEGYLMGLYSMKSWMVQSWITSSSLPSTYEGWVAHYAGDGTYDAGYDKYGETYSTQYGMYQWTDKHYFTYNGVKYGPYDADICYKDYPAIVKEYGFNNYEASGTAAARAQLQTAIDLAGNITHRDYSEATITKIREAYKNAVTVLANVNSTEELLTSAEATLTALLAQTGSNTIAYNNGGVEIKGRNQKITSGDCILYSPTWNNGLITVSNANIAYTVNVVFEWDANQCMNVVKSVTEGIGVNTPSIQLGSNEFMISAHDWESGVTSGAIEGSAENYSLLKNLQVGDRVRLSGATALNAGTDVEPGAFAKFMPKESAALYGRNTAVTAGSAVLFTPTFNEGLLTSANANIHLTLNLKSKWDNDRNSWVVTEKFSGSGVEGESSNIELESDEILFAAHYDLDNSASIYNWGMMNSAEVGDKITFSGISPQSYSTGVSVAANISFSDGASPEVPTPEKVTSAVATATTPGDTGFDASLTDGVADTDLEGAWFGFLNNADSENCNTQSGVGSVTIDLGQRYNVSTILAHFYVGDGTDTIYGDSVGAPASATVYVSVDGSAYYELGELPVDECSVGTCWATYAGVSSVARYIRIDVACAYTWTLLNEVQMLGTVNDLSGENVALGKECVSPVYTGSPYTASLTDGKATSVFQEGVNNSSWFGFYNSGNESTGNINPNNNNRAIATIDLQGVAEITGINIHTFMGENTVGATAFNYINVYYSMDGVSYLYLSPTISPTAGKSAPYWATLDASASPVYARYVKFAISADAGELVLINEIQVMGTMLTGNSSAQAGEMSTVALVGTFNNWNATPNMQTVDEDTVSTTMELAKGTYEFKILGGNSWYGHTGTINNTTMTTSQEGVLFVYDGASNCVLNASGGTYTFVYNKMTNYLQVFYTPDICYLRGSFNNWGTDNEMTENEDGTFSTTLVLSAGEYEFKAANDDFTMEWPQFNATLSLDRKSQVTFTLDILNDTITADIDGLEFTVTFSDRYGTLLSTQTVDKGTAATAPEAPELEGFRFSGWSADFDNVTEDIIVKAMYERTIGSLKINITGGTGFTISMNGSAARPQGTTYVNSKAPIGVDVTVTANTIEGREFIGWMNPANGQILTTDYSYSFITMGNDFFKAVYVTPIEGVNTVIFKNDKAAGGLGMVLDMQYYSAGDDIVIPEDPAQVGYDFAGWNMTVEEIQAEIAAGNDVTVLANWTRQIVKVQVTVTGGSGTGQYNANAAVTVVANTAPEGQRFAYWTIDGVVKSYSETLKFYPTSDCQVEAVFVAEDAEIEYQILVNVDTIDTTSIAD
ncbi:MAG: InlB B-repeat-containing protein, partial [Ruminococcus sp.]|nr:InlB B-repeat-containing protein [Ruminococcus sp.]